MARQRERAASGEHRASSIKRLSSAELATPGTLGRGAAREPVAAARCDTLPTRGLKDDAADDRMVEDGSWSILDTN